MESLFGKIGHSEDGGRINMWWFALGLIAIYSPLAWVRKLGVFSVGFIVGNVMIVFTALVISGYSIDGLIKDGPQNDGFQAVNQPKMWNMIGFSFYCFEGIGVLMPIMEQTRHPEAFPKILTAALFTLATIFVSFGYITYKYLGNMKENIVIYNLDDQDFFLKITKFLFCINLVFSYPLTIYPANQVIESFLF